MDVMERFASPSACGCLGVDCLDEGMEFHTAFVEVIEHPYQIGQPPTLAKKFAEGIYSACAVLGRKFDRRD